LNSFAYVSFAFNASSVLDMGPSKMGYGEEMPEG